MEAGAAANHEQQNAGQGSYGRSLFYSLGMTTVLHPQVYVKVLIQVGHEPLPPVPTSTLFGKKVWRLPNLFQYAGHIRQVDGWFGLYRGLGPRIAHNLINTSVTKATSQMFSDAEGGANNRCDERKPFQAFLKETGELMVAKTAGCVLSYPFHVISIRMMVQFIGRETHYSSIISSIKEIYQEEGLGGFFSGLIPHLFGELLALWILRTLNYVALNYMLSDELSQVDEVRSYSQVISNYVSSVVTYPFQLVTNLMAINDTRLAAGNPPLVGIYSSWTECWSELGKQGLRNRGSALFRRTAMISPN